MVKKAKGWKSLLVPIETPIVRAIEVIDSGGLQIVLVVDAGGALLGTITDGDVRRGILRGVSLDKTVAEIMNRKPVVANSSASRSEIFALLKSHNLRQIPILDSNRGVLGISVLGDFLGDSPRDNLVVLMAGGEGRRLYPLTKDVPKPMLKVGSRPILETIVAGFVSQGFKSFFVSVNYRAEMVKEYFGDGSRFSAEIRYLEEPKSLGTAGSLGLLPERPDLPVVVMNGDVLTKVNFHQLLDFHEQQGADATMCVRDYEFQVPFGVVTLDEPRHQILSIDEKPTHKFFVNGGIYVLNPSALELIPKGEPFDMPSLFARLIEKKRTVAAFPVREYWMDIGRLDDFERANDETMGLPPGVAE